MYIVVEGPIGAGKTSLTNLVSEIALKNFLERGIILFKAFTM